MAGQGVEHKQIPVLEALYRGTAYPSPITPDLIAGGTPNQDELGAAIALRAPLPMRSTAPLERVIAVDHAQGHMAGGPKGNEFLAPSPHDQLWQVARGLILLWAPAGPLQSAAIDWWACHHALISQLWTVGGLRTPCGRFKWPAGMPARPSWLVDSLMHARLLGMSEAGLGNHPSVLPLEIWDEVLHRFGGEILGRMRTIGQPAVQTPVLRWDKPDGGFVAAFADELQMSDALRVIEVDAVGNVLRADVSLSGFTAPAALKPATVGRRVGSEPVPAAPEPPTSAVPSVTDHVGRRLEELADRITGLRLARAEHGRQAAITAELRKPLTRPLASIADDVERFGIGPGQPQKAEQDAIVAALRG